MQVASRELECRRMLPTVERRCNMSATAAPYSALTLARRWASAIQAQIHARTSPVTALLRGLLPVSAPAFCPSFGVRFPDPIRPASGPRRERLLPLQNSKTHSKSLQPLRPSSSPPSSALEKEAKHRLARHGFFCRPQRWLSGIGPVSHSLPAHVCLVPPSALKLAFVCMRLDSLV